MLHRRDGDSPYGHWIYYDETGAGRKNLSGGSLDLPCDLLFWNGKDRGRNSK